MAGWSTESTIVIWGEQNIQEQLDGVSRNRTIYEKIATVMRVRGIFDYKQCRKVKNSLQNIRIITFEHIYPKVK